MIRDQSTAVAAVRSFNRTVAERIGALEDEYLARGRSLGASRLLWEIPEEGSDLRSLRSRLDLDSGYLSRLVQTLEADGLVETAPSGADRRVRAVVLTDAGRAERGHLDAASDQLAASLLQPLDTRRRNQLVEACERVELLLLAGAVEIETGDPRGADAEACLAAYMAEIDRRFADGFDPDHSLPVDPDELVDPSGTLLLARLRGEAIGCVGAKWHRHGAEIKRMWVSADSRGLGVGRRLLAEIEDRARERGLPLLQLDTNQTLVEAIELYRSAGFVEIEAYNAEPYAHHWFEKRLDRPPSDDGDEAAIAG